MNLKYMTVWLEINLLNLFIRLLSESVWVQVLVRWLVRTVPAFRQTRAHLWNEIVLPALQAVNPAAGVMWAFAGLLAGFLIGYASLLVTP